jgi:ABC-type branched-subunit amino acid transport system substrate-binding protein
MRRPRTLLLAALTGISLLAAACSSSSSNSAASNAGAGGTAAAASPSSTLKGAPILLGLMAPSQSNSLSEPWIVQAARIGAAAVNAAGGIDGRLVQIDYCDDHSSAQGGAICAQKLLVQDKVVMMVGDDGTQEPSLLPTLGSANTISFGSMAASLQSLQNPRVFVIDPVEAEYWVMPQMFPKTTHKVVYLPEESAIAQQAAKANTAFLPKGITAAAPVTIPSTATSMQPYCLQIKASGADTVIPAMNPGQVATLIQTCNQVGLTNVLWAITTFEITPQAVQVLSQLHAKNLVVLGLGGGTIEQQFAADVATYGPQVGGITNTLAEPAINAWLAVKLLPQVVKGAGSLDPAKIMAWLNKQTAFSTLGASAPIDFATTPVPQIPRLKNLSGTEAEAENGKIVVLNPKPFSLHM